MDYLKRDSTKRVLQLIAEHNGQFSWYNVAIRFDTSKVPTASSYHILRELTGLGFLRTEPPENSNESKYWLTEKGQTLWDSLKD